MTSFAKHLSDDPLGKLAECGQSYWLDDLSREMIVSGELKRRMTEEGLRGVTTNPTIFNKALSRGTAYDAQIAELVRAGRSSVEIYEALTVKDVQDACDVLRPVHEETRGEDGFVSLEVSPYLAQDTQGTQEEARRFFRAVDRRNCFIKIPGTAAGLPAIEQMLYEGVNINITLLFSIERYEAVIQAYFRGLERRLAEGKELGSVSSVASFFLSRIDVLTDQLLRERMMRGDPESDPLRAKALIGKTAVANAKLAYQSFKGSFSGKRWKMLAGHGARVQRPLWASTSSKDPSFRDVCYVEPLIGRDTVNTMPEETIRAFRDHGVVKENSIEDGIGEARKVLKQLEAAGIQLDLVTRQLEDEGVRKFMDSYDQLIKDLAHKRETFMGGRT